MSDDSSRLWSTPAVARYLFRTGLMFLNFWQNQPAKYEYYFGLGISIALFSISFKVKLYYFAEKMQKRLAYACSWRTFSLFPRFQPECSQTQSFVKKR